MENSIQFQSQIISKESFNTDDFSTTEEVFADKVNVGNALATTGEKKIEVDAGKSEEPKRMSKNITIMILPMKKKPRKWWQISQNIVDLSSILMMEMLLTKKLLNQTTKL